MKIYTPILIGALITAGSLMAQTTNTNDLVKVSLRAICVSTNSSGNLTNQFIINKNLIQDCADEMGLTNLNGLSLVYNRTNPSLQVVEGYNHTLLCTPLTFESGTQITNTNNTVVQGLYFIFAGSDTNSSGTLTTTERFVYGSSNQLTSFSLVGRFQYAIAAGGTNGASLCRGILLVGTRSAGDHDGDNEDNDDDDDGGQDNGGNQGDNDNHGRGNHGHSRSH